MTPRRQPNVHRPVDAGRLQMGRVGIWSGFLRQSDPAQSDEVAGEVESLGFSALWFPGGVGGDVFGLARRLLAATQRVHIGIGVVNIWMHTPEEVAEEEASIEADHPGRLIVGLGVSHRALIEATDQRYERPLAVTTAFLERLNELSPDLVHQRLLGALGPRMLELARDHTGGAHPYMTTPDHTAFARGIMGEGPVLAVEQGVLVEPDADRERAREFVHGYLKFDNYTRNFARMGFTDDDIAGDGSDALVDALVPSGPEAAVATVRRHLAAGADHVCVQVLTKDRTVSPLDSCRELAAGLGPELLGAHA